MRRMEKASSARFFFLRRQPTIVCTATAMVKPASPRSSTARGFAHPLCTFMRFLRPATAAADLSMFDTQGMYCRFLVRCGLAYCRPRPLLAEQVSMSNAGLAVRNVGCTLVGFFDPPSGPGFFLEPIGSKFSLKKDTHTHRHIRCVAWGGRTNYVP